MFFFFFFSDNSNGSNRKLRSFEDVKWQHTANKGEWSELYTLYKLLADQNLFPINLNESIDEQLRMPILSILRFTDKNICSEYRINDDGHVYINANGNSIIEVNRNDFEEKANEMLEAIIKGASDSSFEIRFLNEFRKITCCPKIKCYSKKLENGNNDKSDLYIVIHDTLTGQTPKLGFSIKSELGNPPTLLNASNVTNFKYRLTKNLPTEIINQINSMFNKKGKADIQRRVRTIINSGVSLEFCTIAPNKKGEYLFLENLILIDSLMPEILAHLLVMSYTENTRLLDELTAKLTMLNPLNFPMRANKKYYEAKVKRFVTDVALGMLPNQPWDANHQAAGILVVTESGNIDCYHVIYKSTLDEYLYHDLKFETPSATRHGFGYIETGEDGQQYFTLNLQLRFIR
ncbi:MAG: HpaII family restriction endonuclease [Muribaculaceae bacterium]|nr:HpaII family restriction endonuclease [Muribaculaceae bacterium]